MYKYLLCAAVIAAAFCVGCGDNSTGSGGGGGNENDSTYTITFDANGGAFTPEKSTTGIDGRLASLPTLRRNGHDFDGWYTTAKTGGTQVTTGTVFNGNTVIYARWTLGNATFVDDRDGTIYKMVTLGTQTWMAENLNFAASNSACYDNNVDSCAQNGRLYDWHTAVISAYESAADSGSVQGACPMGWHLPLDDEWDVLMDYIENGEMAGTSLKSKAGWNNNGNGTDAYEFSALPGGIGNHGNFISAGYDGYWWSATGTEGDTSFAWYRSMGYNHERVDRYNSGKRTLFSVRCVSDTGASPTYTLTTDALPTEGGTVSPATASYNIGTTVTVTATPEPGYTFIGWTGTGVPTPDTTNPVTVRMNGDKTLTANFKKIEEVPREIIPDEIRDKIVDKMPLYTGATPPDIIGQYLANSEVLVGSSLSYDVIGRGYADLYIAFVMGSNGKLSYQEKTGSGLSSGKSDDVIVEVVGNSNNFTAYFIKTGVTEGISTKSSVVVSGTLTSSGISNFHYAFVMLETGPDPDNKIVDVNTYRIFKEDDGLAANYNWLSKGRATPTPSDDRSEMTSMMLDAR